MNKLKNILFLALVGFALASCVTARKVNYMQKPDKYIPSYADTLSFEDYVLRIGDRLYVYVYSLNEEVMKMYNAGGTNASQMRQQMGLGGGQNSSYDLYTYLVDEEGNIDFPTIGKVYVQGLTTRDVKHELERQLGTLITEMPGYSSVSVEVNVVNRSFSIVGAQSGRYPITKEKMTIFEALALAGDLGEFNSRKEIKLVREINGVTTIKTFDARSEDLVNSEYYYIEPNDIIYIRQIPGYSFGINHVTTVIGVTAATISFGVFICFFHKSRYLPAEIRREYRNVQRSLLHVLQLCQCELLGQKVKNHLKILRTGLQRRERARDNLRVIECKPSLLQQFIAGLSELILVFSEPGPQPDRSVCQLQRQFVVVVLKADGKPLRVAGIVSRLLAVFAL